MIKHKFRFSWQAFETGSAKEWHDKARKAEDSGFSAFHLADHYLGPGPALEAAAHPVQNIAAVPAIMSAASATSSCTSIVASLTSIATVRVSTMPGMSFIKETCLPKD